MKKISVSIMGEKFELELEDEFFEFVKEDLFKLQNPTPKDLLFLILQKNKEQFETIKEINSILNKIDQA
ncbi:hypothetical protein [Caminibacter sp.]